ncbi:MAG: hypothetical protein N2490_00300 [Ignavibacteria bacterium]|nr:hypothetical protein [Ignavibacteria bacterium]
MVSTEKIFYTIVTAVFAIFTAFVFWTVWTETLIKLLNKNDYRSLIFNIIGYLIIYSATLIIIWGGFLIVRDTYRLSIQKNFINRIEKLKDKSISNEEKERIRKENSKSLFSVWVNGLKWLAMGFILFIIAIVIINL